MRKRRPVRLGFTVLAMACTFGSALACTGGALTAADGGVVVGRTLEFGVSLDSQLAVWPAGSSFTGTTENGNDGLAFTSNYGFIGATAASVHDQIIDGLNEKGLNVGVFYFPGYAEYAEATPDNLAKGLSPGQVSTWILAKFASVDEVKASIDQIAALPVKLDLLGIVPPIHFKVQDASGKAITIEPIGGTLRVTDNPVRVLTNSPDFQFMMTNLSNYLNLSPGYPQSKTIGDLTIAPFGMGGGAVGLPGDFTPPSRFVRMAFFTRNVPTQPDTATAVSTLFHLLNNFDIPYGSVQPPSEVTESHAEITTWTSVSDLQKLQYHWKTYGHQSVRMIDLREALQQAGDQMIHREMGPQAATDMSPSTAVSMQ